MLQRDDVPFGARALERGIQIEGIWISNHNTPIQSPHPPATPLGSRPSSPATRPFLLPSASSTSGSSIGPETVPTNQSLPTYRAPLPQHVRPSYHPDMDIVTANHYIYEPQRPGGIYSPVMTSPIPDSPSKPSRFQRRSEILTGSEKRASFHTRIRRASHLFEKSSPAGPIEHERTERTEKAELGSTSKGSGSQPEETHRASRITRKSLPTSPSVPKDLNPGTNTPHRYYSPPILRRVQTQDEPDIQR